MSGGKDLWRCFVAVDIAADVIRSLCETVGTLRQEASKTGDDMRWTKAGNWHVTLKFLGDVNKRVLDKVVSAVSTAVQQHSPFYVTVRGLMTLPPGTRAKVIAARVIDGGRLGIVADTLDEVLEEQGFERESRSFNPHLTVARVRRSRISADLYARIDERGELEFGECSIDRVTLYRSELSAAGSRYTPLSNVSLRADDDGI